MRACRRRLQLTARESAPPSPSAADAPKPRIGCIGRTLCRLSFAISLLIVAPAARAEIGTVELCPFGTPPIVVSSPSPGGIYSQPLSIVVAAPQLLPQSVVAQLSGTTLTVTLSGTTGGNNRFGCGKVQINPIAAGSYTIAFSLIRDAAAPVSVQSTTVTVAAVPPPPPPPPQSQNSPPAGYDFAATQPAAKTPFRHSVSNDGAALVTMPIEVPPGRQGMQPSLALSYSSRNGNGPLGVGWGLAGLSSITTCRRSPAIDGAYGDQYPDRLCLDGRRLVAALLALDGQRLAPSNGQEYRIESDPFSKVVAHGPTDYPDWFEVYTPTGTILHYASRSNSHARVEGNIVSCVWGAFDAHGTWSDVHGPCAEGTTQRRAWMLDEIVDRFDNRMEIDYDAAEPLLPVEIRYTYHGHGRVPWLISNYLPATKKISFEYATRTDIRRYSMDGIDYTASKLLKTVKVIGPLGLSDASYAGQSGVLRQYALTYTPNPVTAQSTLTQLQECAGDQAGAPCKDPLTFAYSGTSIDFEDKIFTFSPAVNLPSLVGWNGFRTADVNGDGFDDLLYRVLDLGPAPHSGWFYRLSDGQTLGAETNSQIAAIANAAEFGVGFVDFDRNQTVDALLPAPSGVLYNPYVVYTVAQAKVDGTFQSATLPSSAYNLPGIPTPDIYSSVFAIADFNGDGKPDLAVRFGAGASNYRWGVALNASDQSGIKFSNAADFLLFGSSCMTEDGNPYSGNPFANCPNANTGNDVAFVVDIDGNGTSEVIVPRKPRGTDVGLPRVDSSGNHYVAELTALGYPIGTATTERRTGLSSKQVPRVFLDVNGDGLANSVHLENGKLWVAMNKGGSFDAPQAVLSTPAMIAAFALPNEVRIGDFNNDGFEDIYLVSTGILLQSNGNLGFVEKSLPFPIGDDSCQAGSCPDFARRQWDQTLDFDGDGLIDFVQMRDGSTHIQRRIGPAPALLQQVTGGPLTAEVRFVYRSTPEAHTAETCAYPLHCLQKGVWLVGEVGTKADVANQDYPDGFNRRVFSYKGGRFDVRGRGWLGFSETTVIDAQTGAKTVTSYDNSTTHTDDPVTGTYRYPGALRPSDVTTEVDTRMAGETSGRIRGVSTHYQYQDQLVFPYFCPCATTSTLSEVRTVESEASATGATIGAFVPLRSRRTVYVYNPYGTRINQVEQVFEGDFAADGKPPAGAAVKQLEIVWDASTVDQANWLIRRYNSVSMSSTEPAHAAVSASASGPATPATAAQVSARGFALLWQPGTMAISEVKVETSSSADISIAGVTDFKRNSTGNLRQVDIAAHDGSAQTTRSTLIDWDTLDETFPHKVTNPLQQSKTFYYQAGLGRLAVRDDANGLRTVLTFDRFGRLRAVDNPSAAATSIDYALSNGRLEITQTQTSGGIARSFVDKWGQKVRTETSRLDGKMAISERSFTRTNQLATQTFPYYQVGLLGVQLELPAHVAYAYDNLGRIRSKSVFDSRRINQAAVAAEVETWTYQGLTQHRTDARGIESTSEVDARSRVIRTATLAPAPASSPGLPLHLRRHQVVGRYEYGPFDLLAAITDPAGNRIERKYDGLGRLTDTTDPSAGHSTIQYNGYGETKSYLDGVGIATTVWRDALGRVTWENHADPTRGTNGTEIFTWDTAANGIGKLADATSTDGIKTTYGYDGLGRVAAKTWAINGEQFGLETIWDAFDRPQLLKYPAVGTSRLTLEYDYQPQGALFRVINQATQDPYWTLLAQDASGRALSEQFGNSTITATTVDSRARLRSIETTPTALVAGPAAVPAALQALSYDYGPGNLIKARTSGEGSAATAESFDYDYLGRLAHWTVTQKNQTSTQGYGYDDIGNLTAMTVAAGQGRTVTSLYGPAPSAPNTPPYAIREMDENGTRLTYWYDSAGRQVAGAGYTIVWNEFNLPSVIRKSGSLLEEADYKYDANHDRAMRAGPDGILTYVGRVYERRPAAQGHTHVFNLSAGGRALGQVRWSEVNGAVVSGDTSFFHADLLGSPQSVSDAVTGARLEVMAYEPFGQRRNPSTLSLPAALPSTRSFGFTGHEPEDEFHLINMGGRLYDPATTRFLTPDPVVQSPLFLQSVNRYAYVHNNPVNFVDPTGFQSAPDGGTIFGGWNDDPGPGGWPGGGDWGFGEFQWGFGSSPPSGPIFPQTPGSPPQQSPTKADVTRQTADAGPGWGVVSQGATASTGRSQQASDRLDIGYPERYVPPELDQPGILRDTFRGLFNVAAVGDAFNGWAADHPYLNIFIAVASFGTSLYNPAKAPEAVLGWSNRNSASWWRLLGETELSAATLTAPAEITPRLNWLVINGSLDQMLVQGVQYGTLVSKMENGTLKIYYSFVENVFRISNQFKVINYAFEESAVEVARQSGASSVRITVTHVVNDDLAAYLETVGYRPLGEPPPGSMGGKTWSKDIAVDPQVDPQ